MAYLFPAKYDGHCSECTVPISVGDLIGWDGHYTVCEDCATKPEPKPDICPKCFMARASNGTCGCED